MYQNRNHIRYYKQTAMINRILLLLFTGIAFMHCKMDGGGDQSAAAHPAEEAAFEEDSHTYAALGSARTTHLTLDLTVDFDKKILGGKVIHKIDRNGGTSFVVDMNGLDIKEVRDASSGEPLEWKTGKNQKYLGQPLTITLGPNTEKVEISYLTRPDALALDWLDPVQTADGKHPFLFTQGQAILTRSWIPLQDSPGIRITYDATIRVPSELLAVMSADNPQEKNSDGVYHFSMKQPIPPYLMALSVGDLAFRPIGLRTGVYAEQSVVDAAAEEFSDMEKMLEAAEGLYGEYLWDRYDLIVLPPSFPFGGMENPKLTFATPTIIAGDKSLTALIAHELAHSWSGNLVTNATWNDFWLNEGFTVYFERRIMEALYGKDYTNMLALLGRQDLDETIKKSDPKDTHLYLDLDGRDPDDGMTDVAYEKGALFLKTIEEKVGREKFDRFLVRYFERYKFRSMTTGRFLKYLETELLEPNGVDIDIDAWVYGPGIPPGAAEVHSDRFLLVDEAMHQFLEGSKQPGDLQTNGWSTHEWLHFIRQIPDDLSIAKMEALDDAFNFTNSGNSEILAAWYERSIRNGYADQIMPSIIAFLTEVGRRKFLTPLYRALKETGREETARKIFSGARQNYHSVSAISIEDLLNS